MRSNRILSLALCFGVAFALLAGSAFAGSTTAGTASFARELGQANQVYVIPAGKTATRNMGIIRSVAQDLFIDVTLIGGATFDASGLPVAGDVAMAPTTGGTFYSTTLVSGGTAGTNTVRFFVDVNGADMTGLGTATIDVGGWAIKDPTNVLGGGGSYGISVSTSDPATNTPVDVGGETVAVWIRGDYGTSAGPLVATTAVVNVGANRKNFVDDATDDPTADNGATLAIDNSVAGVYHKTGDLYTLTSVSSVNITLAGDLNGITSFSFNGNSKTVTTGERAGGSSVLTLLGDNASLDGAAHAIVINVDGTTILSSRVLTLAVNLALGASGADGPVANNRTLLAAATVSTWSLNGTILITNYANGNNGFLQSRLYIYNPAASVAGDVIARVFTLPLSGGSNAQVGASVTVGTIQPGAGMNIRLAEDILTPAGVTLPYTANGGNVFVELTIQANNVSGVSQSWTASSYFGIYNMAKVQ